MLSMMNNRAAEAASGNKEAGPWFQRVGISLEFVRQNLGDTEAMARRTVDAIAALSTVAARTAAAADLMGRQAKQAVGAMAEGSPGFDKYAATIAKLGGTITKEDARMAVSWAKMAGYAGTALDGIQRAAAKPVLALLEKHFGDVEEIDSQAMSAELLAPSPDPTCASCATTRGRRRPGPAPPGSRPATPRT
jgi:hypothetical protein